MSDVLIRNMKMPKSCDECWMTYEGDSDNCPVVNESVVKYMVEEKRHPSCPLVEVKSHGRLIDADFFKGNAIRVHTQEGKEYIPADYIDIVPTVLEASDDT